MGTVDQFGRVTLELVTAPAEHGWFRELVGRYHYLGYRVPFGAHLRYLAFVSQPRRAVVAALQVSSPAWRLAVRDRWIGWDEATRQRRLQHVVNQSRFRGTCYRAANWVALGTTTGRGRMDRHHQRHGTAPKQVLVYPLVADAAGRLREV